MDNNKLDLISCEIQLSLVLGKLQPTKHAFVIPQIELKHMIERVMPR